MAELIEPKILPDDNETQRIVIGISERFFARPSNCAKYKAASRVVNRWSLIRNNPYLQTGNRTIKNIPKLAVELNIHKKLGTETWRLSLSQDLYNDATALVSQEEFAVADGTTLQVSKNFQTAIEVNEGSKENDSGLSTLVEISTKAPPMEGNAPVEDEENLQTKNARDKSMENETMIEKRQRSRGR
mmetsp:Transcript_26869/g.53667  ORF Transcript_26869/g.53667 Transcript_26869/m.53667 type:complete len:187 (+) Transcript_26869:93-653(+)